MIRIARSIRNGWIRAPKEEKEEEIDPVKDLWKGEMEAPYRQRLEAPQRPPPTTAESYNPPAEYLFNDKELQEWEEEEEEDRKLNFIPQKYDCMRHVPVYENAIKEVFERCLDLYLCTRIKKNRLNIDPEQLLPKLPDVRDLQPFPQYLATTFEGHEGLVRSISISPDGEYLISGSHDGTCRFWETETGRELQKWTFESPVEAVEYNPNPERPCFAALIKGEIHIQPFNTASQARRDAMEDILSKNTESQGLTWVYNKAEKRLTIKLETVVSGLRWHRKGDFLLNFGPQQKASSVYVHRVSLRESQKPFSRPVAGRIKDVHFHPTKPQIFVATDRILRVYDLAKQKLTKKISTSCSGISSISIHPKGEHVLIAGYDRRVYWYDLGLKNPVKNLKYHRAGVQQIKFHPTRPLFASCGNDGDIQIFHAKVFEDWTNPPRIVPVKTLNCLQPIKGIGVVSLDWHPQQAWVFAAGADHKIYAYL